MTADTKKVVVRRFGESETPALLESVAQALANRGAALNMLNRPQDALEACDEVVRRFGESEIPTLLESVAQALRNKGSVLGALNRPQDALEACDEVVRRFGESETPALLASVAHALMNRGAALGALNRPQDALEAWNEVVRRCGENDSPAFSVEVTEALLRRADIEIESRQYERAAETAGRVIDRHHKGSPAQQLRGHVIRAKALLAAGDRSECEHDVETALVIARSLPLLTDAQGRVRRPSQRARRRRQRNPRSSRRPSAPAPVAAGRAGTAQAGPSPPSMRQGAQRLAPDGVRATDVVSPRSSSPCGYASTQA